MTDQPTDNASSATLEKNKALVRRMHVEPLEQRRSSVFDELVTDDYVDADAESADERVPGPEGIKRVNERFLHAFSEIHVTIEDQVAEGNKVVTRWSTEATHSGQFMGIPPTGKRVRTTGIGVHLIRDGRIAAEWGASDELGLLSQLGAVEVRRST